MDTATLMAKLEAAEVPCGPIYSLDEAFNDPQARHLGLSQPVTATDGREINLPRQPFTLSRTPSSITRRTPEFAEHTDELMAEFGFSADEIKGFREHGALE
jgi:crotonobetainyl-CoA:carnitine CoA-transferase CaiB-like acyl-CoA transferase